MKFYRTPALKGWGVLLGFFNIFTIRPIGIGTGKKRKEKTTFLIKLHKKIKKKYFV